MLTLRTRIFIAISLVVLFILGISLIIIVSNKKNQNNQAATSTPQTTTGNIIDQSNFNSAQLQPNANTTVPSGLPVKAQTSVETEQNGVKQFAKIFAERYGSYSSDGNSQNVRDVETLVTLSLWTKISAKINTPQTAQSFYGITTRVITADLTKWSDSNAEVSLKTVRTETKSGNTANRYQNATVNLVKTGGTWLVDKFVWQ